MPETNNSPQLYTVPELQEKLLYIGKNAYCKLNKEPCLIVNSQSNGRYTIDEGYCTTCPILQNIELI